MKLTSSISRAPRAISRRGVVAVTAATMVLAGAGCGADGSGEGAGPIPAGGKKVEVVATTMQLQDFARQVGGDRVSVSGILGPGNEPHEYEPTPSDADAVSRADVVLANGANLDEWLDDLLSGAGGDATRVATTEGIDLLPTDEEGFPGDPHTWHDPDRAKQMVDNVAAGLARADREGAAAYRRGADAYKRRLDEMAETIRGELAAVPPEERKLVTTHDAFGYFAEAYDVDVVGTVLPSVSTETEASGRQVRELVDTIRNEDVEVIFTEEGVDPKLERQIAREAGVEVNTGLYADVLGPPGSGAETFVDAELANARVMLAAWRR